MQADYLKVTYLNGKEIINADPPMAEAEGEKKFVSVNQLKEGSYVLIDGFPCQIKDIEKSKPGKHGPAKARITGVGLFDLQKRQLLISTGSDADVPIVKRGTAQVVAIMGDILQIMDTADYTTYDAPNPKDIQGLTSGAEVEYLQYGLNIRIVRKK